MRNKLKKLIARIKHMAIILKNIKIKKIRLQKFGNDYGGYKVGRDLIADRKKIHVLSFGIGEDLSFSEELIEKTGAEVFAFDPTPRTVEYIADHRLSKEKRFHFYPIGLSVKSGTEVLYYPENQDHVSMSANSGLRGISGRSLEVKMLSFDSIMEKLGVPEIDILKMDIEGSEFEVMESVLKSGVLIKQVALEVHDHLLPDRIGEEQLGKLIKLFSEYHYKLIYLSKRMGCRTQRKEETCASAAAFYYVSG